MRCSTFLFALLPALSSAVNIVLSNDDGWAEINIRQFYSALTSAGNSVIISAPAENESGTGDFAQLILRMSHVYAHFCHRIL
jgi:5'/3'-nucleotidase SurE